MKLFLVNLKDFFQPDVTFLTPSFFQLRSVLNEVPFRYKMLYFYFKNPFKMQNISFSKATFYFENGSAKHLDTF